MKGRRDRNPYLNGHTDPVAVIGCDPIHRLRSSTPYSVTLGGGSMYANPGTKWACPITIPRRNQLSRLLHSL